MYALNVNPSIPSHLDIKKDHTERISQLPAAFHGSARVSPRIGQRLLSPELESIPVKAVPVSVIGRSTTRGTALGGG